MELIPKNIKPMGELSPQAKAILSQGSNRTDNSQEKQAASKWLLSLRLDQSSSIYIQAAHFLRAMDELRRNKPTTFTIHDAIYFGSPMGISANDSMRWFALYIAYLQKEHIVAEVKSVLPADKLYYWMPAPLDQIITAKPV